MKTRNLVIATLVLASVALTTGCGGKYAHGNFGNKIFSKYDRNEDGYINKKEHLSIAMKRFERADDNEDGKVTREELKDNRFTKRFPNLVDNYFAQNDLDNNGSVTKAEIIASTKKEFKLSDTNNDNKLSKNEMKDYRVDSRFRSVDTNKDGVISTDEYKKQKSPFNK